MAHQVAAKVDATGLVCPMPTIRLGQAIKRVGIEDIIELWTDDPGSTQNMAAWCKNTGHELCDSALDDPVFKYWVRRKR